MLCPNCETEVRDQAKFCDECGFPLSGVKANRGDQSKAKAKDKKQSSAQGDKRSASAKEPKQKSQADPQASSDTADTLSFDKTDSPDARDRSENPLDYTLEMPRVEQSKKEAKREFRIDQSEKKRHSVALFVTLGVVVVALAAAFATYALGLWGGVQVPDVRGLTESEARAVLSEHGFSVRTEQVKSDETEGIVLLMDPTENSRVPEGSEIIIHISTTRRIPELVGKSYEEAKALLEEAGYENVRFEKKKSNKTENQVLSVNPKAGTSAKSNVEITVTISEAYSVPDVSSMSADAAVAAITESGLVAQVAYVDTEEYPEGTVLSTSPEANTKVKKNDVVTVQVARARGAELIELTKQLLAPGQSAVIGGTSIAVDSLDSTNYLGNNVVEFSLTGRPYATLMGETVYGSPQTLTGRVEWSDSNEVVSIS